MTMLMIIIIILKFDYAWFSVFCQRRKQWTSWLR